MNVKEMADAILEQFDGAPASNYTKTNLIGFLEEIRDQAFCELAGDVATTLMESLHKFSAVRCSEKQALALAYFALEHNIEI